LRIARGVAPPIISGKLCFEDGRIDRVGAVEIDVEARRLRATPMA
jgi:hypothetical protein